MDKFKQIKRELAYDSSVVALYKDYLETSDGKHVIYDFIHHKSGGGAGMLLVDEEENCYLVKQYRNSVDDICVEIPAGGYNCPEESGEACAIREASEETGLIPGKVYHVANAVSAIGTFDEKTDIFLGMDLKQGKTNYDDLEYIDVLKIPVSQAVQMIYSGEIIDSKTIIAILAYLDLKHSDK